MAAQRSAAQPRWRRPAEVDVRDEHVHDADEVFAVVSGRAQVGLRLGDLFGAVRER
jgi:mannose-6-phosphate isomerase-like protein (cupin superfamily)